MLNKKIQLREKNKVYKGSIYLFIYIIHIEIIFIYIYI